MLEIPIIIFFHFYGVGTVDNEVVPKHLVTQYNGSPFGEMLGPRISDPRERFSVPWGAFSDPWNSKSSRMEH